MLNKAPNNSDVTHVTNIVLNKAPNSKDTTLIGNNVRLTTWAHNNSQCVCYRPIMQKSQLTRDER